MSDAIGDYADPNDAIIAALKFAHQLTKASKQLGKEWGGWVFKKNSGKFAFNIKKGTGSRIEGKDVFSAVGPGPPPNGAIAVFHGHPSGSGFSKEDCSHVNRAIQKRGLKKKLNEDLDELSKREPENASRYQNQKVQVGEWGTLQNRPPVVLMVDPKGHYFMYDPVAHKQFSIVPTKTRSGKTGWIKTQMGISPECIGLKGLKGSWVTGWGPGIPGVDPSGLPGASSPGGGYFGDVGNSFWNFFGFGPLYGVDGNPNTGVTGLSKAWGISSGGHSGLEGGLLGGGDGALGMYNASTGQRPGPSSGSQGGGWTGGGAQPSTSSGGDGGHAYHSDGQLKETPNKADMPPPPKKDTPPPPTSSSPPPKKEETKDPTGGDDDVDPTFVPGPPRESGSQPEGGDGGPVTVEERKEAVRAMFGDYAAYVQAELQAVSEEIIFDKAGLQAWARQFGLGGSGQGENGDSGDDVPEEKLARFRDVFREEVALTTALQKAAYAEYMFESGIFDPVNAARKIALADGQVAGAKIDVKKKA